MTSAEKKKLIKDDWPQPKPGAKRSLTAVLEKSSKARVFDYVEKNEYSLKND